MNGKVVTAEEKADALVKEFCNETKALDPNGEYAKKLREKVRLLVKIQDRDTRHACAEAVLGCDDMAWDCADIDEKLIDASKAHGACINTQAV